MRYTEFWYRVKSPRRIRAHLLKPKPTVVSNCTSERKSVFLTGLPQWGATHIIIGSDGVSGLLYKVVEFWNCKSFTVASRFFNRLTGNSTELLPQYSGSLFFFCVTVILWWTPTWSCLWRWLSTRNTIHFGAKHRPTPRNSPERHTFGRKNGVGPLP